MGAGNQSPQMGGKTADAGKQAMMEAMMRRQMEDRVNQDVRRLQPSSPETELGLPAGYRPGLAPDYQNAEAESRLRELANSSNVEAANPSGGFNAPVKGGISMGPGRSSRYTDEEAQELMRRAQEQRR
jgi:hypothetical protein